MLDPRQSKKRKTTRSGSDLRDMAACIPPQRRPPKTLIQHERIPDIEAAASALKRACGLFNGGKLAVKAHFGAKSSMVREI